MSGIEEKEDAMNKYDRRTRLDKVCCTLLRNNEDPEIAPPQKKDCTRLPKDPPHVKLRAQMHSTNDPNIISPYIQLEVYELYEILPPLH